MWLWRPSVRIRLSTPFKQKKAFCLFFISKIVKRPNIGLSPSGKATDFDSVIPLVRIQPAQPNGKGPDRVLFRLIRVFQSWIRTRNGSEIERNERARQRNSPVDCFDIPPKERSDCAKIQLAQPTKTVLLLEGGFYFFRCCLIFKFILVFT